MDRLEKKPEDSKSNCAGLLGLEHVLGRASMSQHDLKQMGLSQQDLKVIRIIKLLARP